MKLSIASIASNLGRVLAFGAALLAGPEWLRAGAPCRPDFVHSDQYPLTGLVARPGERDVIWEAFKPGTEPVVPGPVLDGGATASEAAGPTPIPASDTGAGGLY